MKPNPKEVGKRIRSLRQEKGLTMEEFGNFIDKANKGAVGNWERGDNLPNNARLKMIAQFGEISVNELLYGTKEQYEKKLIYEIITKKKKLAANNEIVDAVFNRLNPHIYWGTDIYNLDADSMYKYHKDFFDKFLSDTIVFNNWGLVDYSIGYIKKVKDSLEVNFKSSYESDFESSKKTYAAIQEILDTTIVKIADLRDIPNSITLDFDSKDSK